VSVRYAGRVAVAAIGAIGLVLVGAETYHYARGVSLVARGANLTGVIRTGADLDTVHHEERLVRIPMRLGSIAGRVYVPTRGSSQTVLVVTGLHPAGINEPRLVALSRELARSKVTVVTPAIAELSRFEITPTLTDQIEQAALWLATSRLHADRSYRTPRDQCQRRSFGGRRRSSEVVQTLARRLPEPAATLLEWVNNRDVAQSWAQLLPYVGSHVEAAALSPSRAPAPTVPSICCMAGSTQSSPLQNRCPWRNGFVRNQYPSVYS
jgi:hypothetical protein